MSTFGTELKAWRQRRGLSQLRLATDADVSQRHISFLETGRSQPSREMVLHLGVTLDIPPREHNLLFLAAGHAPAFNETDLGDLPELVGVLQTMLDGHEPYMAFVVDRAWNVVASNDAATRFAAHVFGSPPEWDGSPPNIMRLNFHPEGLRTISPRWETTAAALLRRLDRDAAAFPHDEALQSLRQEVHGYHGVQALIDSAPLPSVDDLVVRTRYVVDGEQIDLFTTIAVIGDAHDVTLQELRIETFWPMDARSRDAWQRVVG